MLGAARAAVVLFALLVASPVPGWGAARARVYRENAKTTPVLELLPLVDAPGSPRFRVYSCADEGATREIAGAGFPPSARVCTSKESATPNLDGDFTPEPRTSVPGRGASDPFAEVSAYHHVGRTLAFFRGLLGGGEIVPFDVIVGGRISGVLVGGESADLVPLAGALYLARHDPEGAPFRGYFGVTRSLIWFGETSTVSLAYDGDLIAHETAHAVLDDGRPNVRWRITEHEARREPEALREALADYFAAAQSGDGVIAEHAFEGGTIGPARDLDAVVSADVGIGGDPYAESLAYSGALWRARRAAGSDASKLDAAVARSGRALSPDALATELFDAIARELEAPVRAALDDELARRGVVPSTPRIVTSPGAGVFVVPGRRSTSSAPYAPGTFQVRIAIPSGARALAGKIEETARRLGAFGTDRGSAASFVAVIAWDRPVSWKSGAPRGDVVALGDGAFRVAVPEGAREAWVQIANAGEADGAFAKPTFSFPSPPAPSDGGELAGGCSTTCREGDGAWLLGVVAAVYMRRRSKRTYGVVTPIDCPPRDRG